MGKLMAEQLSKYDQDSDIMAQNAKLRHEKNGLQLDKEHLRDEMSTLELAAKKNSTQLRKMNRQLREEKDKWQGETNKMEEELRILNEKVNQQQKEESEVDKYKQRLNEARKAAKSNSEEAKIFKDKAENLESIAAKQARDALKYKDGVIDLEKQQQDWTRKEKMFNAKIEALTAL